MIAKALESLELAIDGMKDSLSEAERCKHILHRKLDRAQKAYQARYPEDNIVLFSGGTSKPPVDDPDEPVEP